MAIDWFFCACRNSVCVLQDLFQKNKADSKRKPADIPSEAQQFLEKEAKGFADYNIALDYDYWTAGAFLSVHRKTLFLIV